VFIMPTDLQGLMLASLGELELGRVDRGRDELDLIVQHGRGPGQPRRRPRVGQGDHFGVGHRVAGELQHPGR
jgi:hypothetical protein